MQHYSPLLWLTILARLTRANTRRARITSVALDAFDAAQLARLLDALLLDLDAHCIRRFLLFALLGHAGFNVAFDDARLLLRRRWRWWMSRGWGSWMNF